MGRHDEEVGQVDKTVAVEVAGDLCFTGGFTRFVRASVGSQVNPVTMRDGFLTRAIEGTAGINGGASHTIFYPGMRSRIPATGLGAQVKITISRIGEEGIGVQPTLN